MLEGRFDNMLTTSLNGVYLWLFFGYLSAYMNCDLQRLIQNNTVFLHVFGLITFFFLFTSELTPKKPIGVQFLNTIIVYCVWLLATKTKWYFILSTLAALIINQSIQYQTNILIENTMDDDKRSSYEKIKERTSFWTTVIILCVTSIGVIHYIYLQKKEYKGKFSYLNFFFEKGKCKEIAPNK